MILRSESHSVEAAYIPSKKRPLESTGPGRSPQHCKKLRRSSLKSISTTRDSQLQVLPQPLTKANLKALMASGGNQEGSMGPPTSMLSRSSSRSKKSLPATNPAFEAALLTVVGVDFHHDEDPHEESIKKVIDILRRDRSSPEPDEQEKHDFHKFVRMVSSQNETSVRTDLTTKLIPILPGGDQFLARIQDGAWTEWGSSVFGVLPVPQPDICFAYYRTCFSANARSLLTSPYSLKDTFAPRFPIEIKSSMGHTRVSMRQNANNMAQILKDDFVRLKELGVHEDRERQIRFLSAAHNDSSMWWDGWYYVLCEDDEVRWSFRRLAHQPFDVDKDNGAGLVTVQKYNKNWLEYLVEEDLSALQDDLKRLHQIRAAAFQTMEAPAELTPPHSTNAIDGQINGPSGLLPPRGRLPASLRGAVSVSSPAQKKRRQSGRHA
ncbi:hypothetical protein MMC06_004222 [Schaereria dolodes]|nr:hypothetical protein [Schaereria dolodes]